MKIKLYKHIAFISFNTLIILLIINVFSWFYLKLNYKEQDLSILFDVINYEAYQFGDIENKSDSTEINKLINDYYTFLKNGGKEFEYHPATEYQLADYKTEYINIESQEHGFNIRTHSSNKNFKNHNKKIFCFGGSTTFGPFVKNDETWPYFLEKGLVDVSVENFGVPGFVPTQETNQFIYLLKSGYRPSLCIFMDGVNVGPPYDGSDFTRSIFQSFENNTAQRDLLKELFSELPIVKLIQKRPLNNPVDIFKTNNIDFAEIEFGDEYNDIIAQRFIQNAFIRQKIAEMYNVEILQFLQPNGNYNYPDKFHSKFSKRYHEGHEGVNLQKNISYIYKKIISSNCGYIDLTYLFNKYSKPSIIDIIHYSPGFNQFIAEEMATNYISKDSLIIFEYKVNSSTGEAFYLRELN